MQLVALEPERREALYMPPVIAATFLVKVQFINIGRQFSLYIAAPSTPEMPIPSLPTNTQFVNISELEVVLAMPPPLPA
jgi:hypothetical protein